MTSRGVDNTSGRWDLHAPGVTALTARLSREISDFRKSINAKTGC